MTTAHVPSKRPASLLAGPYGHPFHAQVVTLPIGAFTASLLFDLGARLGWVDTSSAAFASAWLLAIGLAGAVLAMALGVMDLTTIPDRTKANRTAVTHGTINSVASVILALSAFLRFSQGTDEVPTAAFVLSVVGLLVLGVGGWLGGKLAYTYGVRVAREARQEDGYRPTAV
ncbi:DUF2231 domain-containing protein [Aquipuribacter hungaricus]|uniref:DUF2231 domain-containing protein n=1 Tax=Aquipuribacter hungaricus TaxID=545624 RepID=A0ABV7WAK3_9MICO